MLRQAAAGPAVLMGVRAAAHRFMPNRLVFPGGAVDPGDASAPAGSEPRADVMAMLAHAAKPRLARAIVLAAARELHEETGLSLGAPPRLDRVEYLCRAVTPPDSPIRFNARFLVVPESATEGTPADSHELQAVGFRPLAELIGTDLVLVTRQVLDRLLLWLAVPEAERRVRAQPDVFRLRRWGVERPRGGKPVQ